MLYEKSSCKNSFDSGDGNLEEVDTPNQAPKVAYYDSVFQKSGKLTLQ